MGLSRDRSRIRPELGPNQELPPQFRRTQVEYRTPEAAPGTIIIDTPNTYLYLVLGNGKALRYGIGVGREGLTWSGTERISRTAQMALLESARRDDRTSALSTAIYGGRGRESVGCARPLFGQHPLSHSRDQPAFYAVARTSRRHPGRQRGTRCFPARSKILGMDAGVLPWGRLVFDAFKGLLPFLRLARLLHQGTMCDLKLAMCGAPDDVLVYAHSYFLALAADRTGDREFSAHEHVSQLFMIRNWKRDIGSAIRAHPTHIGTPPSPRRGYRPRHRSGPATVAL